MAAEPAEPCSASIAAMVEDVLQQHGGLLSDVGLASRKAEEASLRRYEAAGWLRRTVGVVGGKDLPAEPSEEEFRLGLRSGIILCNVLNKVKAGAVPKVVEGPSDSVIIPDGAALCAYQYFENVRNFLVAVEEMGLPTFEASDLEMGGKSSRVVNCVLALKSYSDWKQRGGSGSWKYGGNSKPSSGGGKHFVRRNTELFMNSIIRNTSEKSIDNLSTDQNLADCDLSDMNGSRSLTTLVRAMLSNKKQEEIPFVVESILSKVMEEFEHRLGSQIEMTKASSGNVTSSSNTCLPISASSEMKEDEGYRQIITMEVTGDFKIEDQYFIQRADISTNQVKGSGSQLLKQKMQVKLQERDIRELKHILHSAKEGMQLLQMKYLEDIDNLGKHLHGLVHAASEYQKVLQENRKLYNQVQDLKGNIRVYCRVRPFLGGHLNRISSVDHIEDGSIMIITPSKYGKEGRKTFTFNRAFGPSATQAEVFSDMQPLIRSVLDGYNVCIFAYGQTGSGKTYTMTGPGELAEESLGVNYRALSDLFLISEQRKDTFSYQVFVQMIEIYNEQVRDLLATDASNKKVEIRNSSQNGINVPDANIVRVLSTYDVLNLMNLGNKNRAVGATALNDRSSRSHSCLTVHIQGKDLTSGRSIRGCMHLVDLAGSERVDKAEVTGDRLKEAQHINKSLSALGDVISSLAQKNSHIPYRNSKLTQLLQDSLGGQAKTLMFVHISPEPEALGETISTLKFAERVSAVELGAARVNKDGADVKELKEQIASLKAALARKEGEPDIRHYRSVTPERFKSRLSSSLSHPILALEDGHQQSVDDVRNMELRSPSLDPHDLMNSTAWPPLGNPTTLNGQREDHKELGLGDWVDKLVVNKQDISNSDNGSTECLEEEDRQLSEVFDQTYLLPATKVYPEQPYNKVLINRKDGQEFDVQRSRSETTSVADSDELDAAASDSSEPDVLWQSNTHKAGSAAPCGLGLKSKEGQRRPSKKVDPRSLTPSLIPATSRKLMNGITPPSINRAGRRAFSADGKRKQAVQNKGRMGQ